MFWRYNALLLPVWCHTLLISRAGCIYGKIPSGTQKVDRSSSAWLMLFTEKNKGILSCGSLRWFIILFYFFIFCFVYLVKTSLGASSPWLTNKHQEDGGELGWSAVGRVGSRMKHPSPVVVVDGDTQLKQQMRLLPSHLLCVGKKKPFVHPKFVEDACTFP